MIFKYFLILNRLVVVFPISTFPIEGGNAAANFLNFHRSLDKDFPNSNLLETKTNMNKPDIQSINNNINFAGASLCSEESIKSWTCKSCLAAAPKSQVKGIDYFKNDLAGTAGFIASDTALKTILVVFRGGRSIQNQLQAAATLTVPFKPLPPLALVNNGIKIAMESLKIQFLSLVKQRLAMSEYKNYSITVIGHSHGSSIASLATILLQYKLKIGWPRFNLFVYGQPRIGNLGFSQWFNQQPLTVARVVNSEDCITQFPTKALGYHVHHQNLYYINQHTNISKFCRQDILEDPDCFIYPDITLENGINHILYLGVLLVPEASC